METIDKQFITSKNNGSDDGDVGYGCGNASGCGALGFGNGCGLSNGCGYGDGDGEGAGSYGGGRRGGTGRSFITYRLHSYEGMGSGLNHCAGIKEYCGKQIYRIDGLVTIIDAVKGNIARGRIIHDDLTAIDCYIIKKGDFFAHGKSIKQAVADVNRKVIESETFENKLILFRKTFKKDIKYPASIFFEWHGILTGSCKFGREEFCKKHNINLKKDFFTVKEFKNIVKGHYEYDLIKQL